MDCRLRVVSFFSSESIEDWTQKSSGEAASESARVLFGPASSLSTTRSLWIEALLKQVVKSSSHMIALDRRIAENPASDRQRLYGNTF